MYFLFSVFCIIYNIFEFYSVLFVLLTLTIGRSLLFAYKFLWVLFDCDHFVKTEAAFSSEIDFSCQYHNQSAIL